MSPTTNAPIHWEVEAVRYGTYPSTRGALVLQHGAYGEPDAPQTLDYFFYVLRGGGRTVVVDTGFSAAVGTGRGRTCLVDPVDALGRLGVDPGTVDTLLISHLHYDHIGNLARFSRAKIVVPATELAFWTSPVARHAPFWAHTDPAGLEALQAAVDEGRVTAVGATARVAPGITMLEVGGHSPGQAMLLVQTAGRPVLLCSDAVHLYEELSARRPFAVVADLPAMYAGYDLVDALAADLGCVVVPGHDPLVATRFPPSARDSVAVRLDPVTP